MKKVLLIGLGNMGKHHFRVLNELSDKQKLDVKTCDIKQKADYRSLDLALIGFKPTYVIIATPTETHKSILDYCLKLNVKYIFVEKPLMPFDNNIFRYKKYDNIMVGHVERFNPMVRRLKQLVQPNTVDTIICTRSGLQKKEDDFSTNIDLVIHDLDVCKFLLNKSMTGYYKNNKNNSCSIALKAEGEIDVFLHADNKSPFKRRMIQIIGNGFFIEGDYIEQTIKYNGEDIFVIKEEPLRLELEYFLKNKYQPEDLASAIDCIKLVR